MSLSFATEKFGGLFSSNSAVNLNSQQFTRGKQQRNLDLNFKGNLEIQDLSLQKEIETLKKVKRPSMFVETPQLRQNLIKFMKKDYK